MNKQVSLKKNFIMSIFLTMSNIIYPLVTFPYVSRTLLPIGVGKVSFATSVITYFSLFAQLGIPTYGIRATAKIRDDKVELSRTVHELLMINTITVVISYGVFFFTLIFTPRLYEDKYLMLIMSSMIFLNSMGIEWLYRGLEKYTYITIRSIVFKFIALIAMFLLVHNTEDYVIYGTLSIFASSASNIMNMINVRKYIFLKNVGGYRLRRHMKPILIFFAMSCATTIYTNLDVVMLGFISGDKEVGLYQTAVKVKMMLVSVITSLSAVLLPRASYYVENNLKDAFVDIAKKAFEFVIMSAIPVMIYFMLYSDSAVLLFVGDSFSSSILPMQIIMPTVVFIGLTNIMGIQILVPLGKEYAVLVSEVLGALINLIINAVLIPQLGAIGAAIGTVIAEMTVLIIQYCYVKKLLTGTNITLSFKAVLLGVGISSICGLWIRYVCNGPFLRLLFSSICFFGSYVIVLFYFGEPIITETIEKSLMILKKQKK